MFSGYSRHPKNSHNQDHYIFSTGSQPKPSFTTVSRRCVDSKNVHYLDTILHTFHMNKKTACLDSSQAEDFASLAIELWLEDKSLEEKLDSPKAHQSSVFFLVDVLLDDYVSPSLKFNIKFGFGNRQKGANFGQWSPKHHGFRGRGIGRCMFPDVNRRTSGKCFGPFGPVLRTCLLKKLSQKGVS